MVSAVSGLRVATGAAMPMAMMVVLTERRRARREAERGRVRAVDVAPEPRGPRLSSRRLRGLASGGTDIRSFDLRRARLSGMGLTGVDLSGADLTGASLRRSDLERVDLTGARLEFADLRRCNLRDADLGGALLLDADLSRADLTGANLAGCHQLGMANLRGVRFDSGTTWPAGFNPIRAGAELTLR
jgi:uncharacterized protein YjbI with pentapeptide repeats